MLRWSWKVESRVMGFDLDSETSQSRSSRFWLEKLRKYWVSDRSSRRW